MPKTPPLVSCVLPTRNRIRFFRQALRYFERQTYAPRELVVVDDGEEPVERLCRNRPGVRYVRLAKPTRLGAKMNLGIERASGVFIHKMDDDDYYAPAFLETALRSLRLKDAFSRIAAWDSFLVLLAGERNARFSGRGWAAGGTLCFAMSLWERAPFRDIPKAVDRRFLEDHGYPLARVRAAEAYMLVRHGANTWTDMGEADTDDWMRQRPFYAKDLADLMAPEDARFYRRLPYPAGATTSTRD